MILSKTEKAEGMNADPFDSASFMCSVLVIIGFPGYYRAYIVLFQKVSKKPIWLHDMESRQVMEKIN